MGKIEPRCPRCSIMYLVIGVVVACSLIGSAHSVLAAGKESPAVPAPAILTGGNGFYNVHVNDTGSRRGVYTATTGPSHPAGNGLNVLFGNGSPGTSFNTIRSYTTNTDYVQRTAASGNPTVLLNTYLTSVVPIGSTGVRTTYTLPGPPTTPDALTIVQDVDVNGTTFFDSTVEVTTAVTNTGASPVLIGIRYLWDFEIGNDDGPTFQQMNPPAGPLTNEAQFLPPSFESYEMVDNDINPSPPTFGVHGTVTGPASVVPTPTAPDLLKYVSWPNSIGTAFDYTVNTSLTIAGPGGQNDVAVLYFFGHDSGSAISIPAAGERTVSASLFVTPPVAVNTGAPALSWAGLAVLASLLAGVGGLGLARRLGA